MLDLARRIFRSLTLKVEHKFAIEFSETMFIFIIYPNE